MPGYFGMYHHMIYCLFEFFSLGPISVSKTWYVRSLSSLSFKFFLVSQRKLERFGTYCFLFISIFFFCSLDAGMKSLIALFIKFWQYTSFFIRNFTKSLYTIYYYYYYYYYYQTYFYRLTFSQNTICYQYRACV